MSEHTPESLIAQYILGAYMHGARYGGEPPPGYVRDASSTALRDLADHGYEISDRPTKETLT